MEAMKTMFDDQQADELAIIWEVRAAEWQLDQGIGGTKATVWYEDQTVQCLVISFGIGMGDDHWKRGKNILDPWCASGQSPFVGGTYLST